MVMEPLETILSRYEGEACLQRLLSIPVSLQDAQDTVKRTLCIEALKSAHKLSTSQGNIRRYKETFFLLKKIPEWQASGIQEDAEWISQQTDQNRTARNVLSQRLQTAKAHLNKEAIRVAYQALAEHDEKTGENSEAFHSALRAKDYCTNRQQTSAVTLQILRTSIHLQNYNTVQEYSNKLIHTVASEGNIADRPTQYKVRVAAGLERLAARDYSSAAQRFTDALAYFSSNSPHSSSTGAGDQPVEVASATSYGWKAVLAPEDVALFGIFLSLAASEYTADLINLVDHPDVLELIPMVREVVVLSVKRADYKAAWCILEKEGILDSLCVDVYMSLHLEELKRLIRERFVLQYWCAYQRMELDSLTNHLGPGIVPQEQALEFITDMIQRSCFPSDTRLRLGKDGTASLIRVEVDPDKQALATTQNKLREVTEGVLNDTYSMIVRLSCVEHNLFVPDPNAPHKRRADRGGGYVGVGGLGAGPSNVVDEVEDDPTEDYNDIPMQDVNIQDTAANPEDFY